MTREEALKLLQKVRVEKFKYTFYTLDEYQAAIDMAIKALKQPSIIEILQGVKEEVRKDVEWWSEQDSLRAQVLIDVIEEVLDPKIKEYLE